MQSVRADWKKWLSTRPLRVVAPASGLDTATMQALTNEWGSVISTSMVNDSTLFHSNTDAYRLADLVDALYDDRPELVIWCLRGGYGSARLLDDLYHLTPPSFEKTVIGCSDITALHVFLHQHWGWRPIHASGLHQALLPGQDINFNPIALMLQNKNLQQTWNGLTPLNAIAMALDQQTGHMHGGNLTVLASGFGTRWQLRPKGALLFLEDVGEKGYRVDRLLNQFRQAGVLDGVNAVIFGEFLGPDQAGIEVALARFAQSIAIPVFKTNQFGHGVLNYPIRYGAVSCIERENGQVFKLVMSNS